MRLSLCDVLYFVCFITAAHVILGATFVVGVAIAAIQSAIEAVVRVLYAAVVLLYPRARPATRPS